MPRPATPPPNVPGAPLPPAASRACVHCGTAFRPTAHRAEFCCAGCQFVYDLISKNGLGQFYDLQDGGVFPVKSVVFQKRDYTWLAELSAAHPEGALTLDLQGISCIGCVWLIEKIFERQPGGLGIHIDTTLGRLQWHGAPGVFDAVEFARQLQSFGYLLGPVTEKHTRTDKGFIVRLGICGALAMNAMLFSVPVYFGMERTFEYAPLIGTGAMACGTLSFLIGGSYFISRSVQSLRAGVLHIDLPISLGLIAAYAASLYAWHAGAFRFVYFDFVSMFTFLMLVGRWVQQVAVTRNRNRLLGMQLSVLEPKNGERFRIESGQVIPVRAKLHSPAASLGLEWINGEAEAREARLGQLVPSGAINLSGQSIELEAMEDWKDSILSRLLELKPRTGTRQPGLEYFIRNYILVVISIAALAFGGWLWTTGDLLRSLQVLTSILVVSCPCASGVALPLADELALSALRKIGLFVREPSLWHRLAQINQIVFDKTGTLTLETMALRNPEALAALGPEDKSRLLAMVRDNLHPVSCCLREQLMAEGMSATLPAAATLHEVIGSGVELSDEESNVWRLGRPEWAGPTGQSTGDCVFSLNGSTLAAFRFGEETRADAFEEIATLSRRGFGLHILSGDRQAKVDEMAARLELPAAQCHGELSPDAKAAWLRENDGAHSLMIGDGANDSLAFNESLCTGTPAIDRGLLEHKSDFYFLGRGLYGIRRLFEVAEAKRRASRGVIGFAIAYNTLAIGLCIAGKMSPLAAAVLMPLSSLVTLSIVALTLRARSR